MPAKVMEFPVIRIPCSSCETPCIEEELSEACGSCGERYCGKSSNGCPSQCGCDRLAIDLAQRAEIYFEGLKLRQAIAQKATRSRSRKQGRTQRRTVTF